MIGSDRQNYGACPVEHIAKSSMLQADFTQVDQRPVSFHEVRSLGGALLHNQQGWSEEQVQHLLTHSSPAMTEVYLEGHERPWTEINTGILAIR